MARRRRRSSSSVDLGLLAASNGRERATTPKSTQTFHRPFGDIDGQRIGKPEVQPELDRIGESYDAREPRRDCHSVAGYDERPFAGGTGPLADGDVETGRHVCAEFPAGPVLSAYVCGAPRPHVAAKLLVPDDLVEAAIGRNPTEGCQRGRFDRLACLRLRTRDEQRMRRQKRGERGGVVLAPCGEVPVGGRDARIDFGTRVADDDQHAVERTKLEVDPGVMSATHRRRVNQLQDQLGFWGWI